MSAMLARGPKRQTCNVGADMSATCHLTCRRHRAKTCRRRCRHDTTYLMVADMSCRQKKCRNVAKTLSHSAWKGTGNMSTQLLGKLWVCLSPNDYEVRDCGSRIFYQQQIILELIEQFGFDQAVFLLKKMTGESDRIPLVKKYLHQLIHLDQEYDQVIIQDVTEVREEHVYRYSWKEGQSIRSITFTTE